MHFNHILHMMNYLFNAFRTASQYACVKPEERYRDNKAKDRMLVLRIVPDALGKAMQTILSRIKLNTLTKSAEFLFDFTCDGLQVK